MNPKQKKAAYIIGAVVAAWLLYSYVKGRQKNPADQLQPDQGQFGIPGAPIAGAYWTGGGGGPTPTQGPSPTEPGGNPFKLGTGPANNPGGNPTDPGGGKDPTDPAGGKALVAANNLLYSRTSPVYHTDIATTDHGAMPHLEPAGSRGAPVVPFPNFITVGGTAGGLRR